MDMKTFRLFHLVEDQISRGLGDGCDGVHDRSDMAYDRSHGTRHQKCRQSHPFFVWYLAVYATMRPCVVAHVAEDAKIQRSALSGMPGDDPPFLRNGDTPISMFGATSPGIQILSVKIHDQGGNLSSKTARLRGFQFSTCDM